MSNNTNNNAPEGISKQITFNSANTNLQSHNHNSGNSVDYFGKYRLIKPYKSLSEDEKKELFRRLDNFLEAIYLAPSYFPIEILFALKYREEKLSMWRLSGQIFGFVTYSALWTAYKFRYHPSFYFRNFCYYFLLAGFSSYLFGRFFEFQANIRYYRDMILKMANDYNISDDEISGLQQKFNEFYLEENQKKSSLDNIKFKL